MVPNCTFELEKSGRFTLQPVCFLGQCPPGTCAQVQETSSVPLHLKRRDLAEGRVLTLDVRLKKGRPGQSVRSSCSPDQVYPRESQVMIATWMLFSLFTVGLSATLAVDFCCLLLRGHALFMPQTHEGTFMSPFIFRDIVFLNTWHRVTLKGKARS